MPTSFSLLNTWIGRIYFSAKLSLKDSCYYWGKSLFPIITSDQEGDEKHVRKEGGKVDNFARRFHRLPDAKVDHDPGQGQKTQQFQIDGAKGFDARRELEHPMAERRHG